MLYTNANTNTKCHTMSHVNYVSIKLGKKNEGGKKKEIWVKKRKAYWVMSL